jgi:hypothetical protein
LDLGRSIVRWTLGFLATLAGAAAFVVTIKFGWEYGLGAALVLGIPLCAIEIVRTRTQNKARAAKDASNGER